MPAWARKSPIGARVTASTASPHARIAAVGRDRVRAFIAPILPCGRSEGVTAPSKEPEGAPVRGSPRAESQRCRRLLPACGWASFGGLMNTVAEVAPQPPGPFLLLMSLTGQRGRYRKGSRQLEREHLIHAATALPARSTLLNTTIPRNGGAASMLSVASPRIHSWIWLHLHGPRDACPSLVRRACMSPPRRRAPVGGGGPPMRGIAFGSCLADIGSIGLVP
jgi:hypothetical protein